MFGSKKIRIDEGLWEKLRRYAQAAGYASADEFATHVLEQAIAAIESADSDEDIQAKLRGLGYLR
ncbi:MAG: hypothetical protein AB7Q97_06205 [Gammaproteobacteria bacterium]